MTEDSALCWCCSSKKAVPSVDEFNYEYAKRETKDEAKKKI